MTEPSWPAPGVECICINSHGWRDIRHAFGMLLIDIGPRPGPEFMQQYKIHDTFLHEPDDPGHRLKLVFAEWPDEQYCACMFRPLVKIEDEETKDTTAPVDKVLS